MDEIIRITKNCNQKCIFCNVIYPTKGTPYEETSIIKIKENIEKIADGGVNILSISGGEPTLRKDLFDIISYASRIEKFDCVTLQTNAVMLSYEEYVKKLRKVGLDSIFVSLHSHREEISNKLTMSNYFDKTIVGIRNALKNRISVTINPVINNLNFRDLPKFVKFVNEELSGVTNISFSFIQPQGRAQNNKWLVPKYSDVSPYLKKALDYCYKKNISISNPYCGFPFCYFVGYERFSTEYYEINEKPGSLINIKNSKVKSRECRSCIYNKRCNGVWKWYADIYGLSELHSIKDSTLMNEMNNYENMLAKLNVNSLMEVIQHLSAKNSKKLGPIRYNEAIIIINLLKNKGYITKLISGFYIYNRKDNKMIKTKNLSIDCYVFLNIKQNKKKS